MRQRKVLLSFAALALFAPAVVNAGAGRWTSIGPYGSGGRVRSIALDPTSSSVVYVSVEGSGIFKSVDASSTWISASEGLDDLNGYALAIDPRASATLYAGTGSGVFKSTNAARSWRRANAGFPSSRVFAMVIDPAVPSTVYAGTADGVLKSVDSGFSWTLAALGGPIQALVIDPSRPSVLYAGIGLGNYGVSGAVFKTTDAGLHWVPAGRLVPSESEFNQRQISALAIDPVTPDILYAGTSLGLYKSVNRGMNWSALLPTDRGVPIVSIVVDPSAHSLVYAGIQAFHLPTVPYPGGGILKSFDAGMTFTLARDGLPDGDYVALAVDPSSSSTLYAGRVNPDLFSDGGLFKSSDSAVSWSPVPRAFHTASVYSLATAVGTTILYAGTNLGIFLSRDRGESWSLSTGVPPGQQVSRIVINPLRQLTLYAGTQHGLFQSEDGGNSWVIASGLPADVAVTPALSPQSPTIVYAGTSSFSAAPELFRSEDAGFTWSSVSTSAPGLLNLVDPNDAQIVYANNGPHLFRSLDGGINWTEILDTGVYTGVRALAVEPGNSRRIYAGITGYHPEGFYTGSVIRSSDGGEHWNSLLSALVITDFVIDRRDPTVLYASAAGNNSDAVGVFRSADGGASWTKFSDGLLSSGVQSLALDLTLPSRIYAGTSQGAFVLMLPRVARAQPDRSPVLSIPFR